MAEITAAVVKALREKTNLPMMECKKALEQAGGDEAAAIDLLRKQGAKFTESRGDRTTNEGRIAIFVGPATSAMIELQCESAPVATNEEFKQLADDLAKQLASGAGAPDPDALWSQTSPSKSGSTLAQQRDDLMNKIREVFRLKRILRVAGTCGSYVHHDAKTGVLLVVEGNNPTAAKEICMHVAAMRPRVLTVEDLDPTVVAKEREILTEAARKEGKPENIIGKMVEGRLRNFYSECVLLEQPFVKDDKQTVGKFATASGLKLKSFTLWRLGEE